MTRAPRCVTCSRAADSSAARPTGTSTPGDARRTGSILSGFVKGWAVDEAAAILTRAGRRAFAINAAGDMRLHGRTWRVGIQHPLERNAVAKVVEAEDLAIATSGAYERGTHVRDPHTGDAPSGVLSVTICGPELATADAYATAAFAMGVPRAIHWTARDFVVTTRLRSPPTVACSRRPAFRRAERSSHLERRGSPHH